jgi:TRAP-type C4-dicarboxylate transport system permease small subunit
MRTIAAVFFLALSVAGIWVISRNHGSGLSHLLPPPGEKGVGVIQRAAPFAIILLTLWALSRLTRRGDSSTDSSPNSSSEDSSSSSDDSGCEPDAGGGDDSPEDDA